MKRLFVISVFAFVILGCGFVTGNTATATPIPPTISYPTSIPFVMPKGDFTMSWNTYDSQYDSNGHILTIRKQGSTYSMTEKFSDGSSGNTPLSAKVVNGEIRLSDANSDGYFGDYMVIQENSGRLSYYDKQGFIYSVSLLK